MQRFAGLTIVLLVCFSSVKGQDRYFSQQFANPMYSNPGLTGIFLGDYRTSVTYRSQWPMALENPFSSFALSADVNVKLKGKSFFSNDRVGAGVQFFADKLGGFDFNTNQISLFGAYHKTLDVPSQLVLSLGFQAGIVQKNVNYDYLRFGDQFLEGSGYSNPTQEPAAENNYGYSDYAVGLNLGRSPSDGIKFVTGLAMHHFATTNISFFRQLDDAAVIPNKVNLFTRLTGYAQAEIPAGDGFAISPRVSYINQGPHRALQAGSQFLFDLTSDRSRVLYLGAWTRFTNQMEKFGAESLTAFGGLKLGAVLVGLSYDTNISGIASAFGQRGSIEFSLIVIGNTDSDGIYCPEF